MRKLLMVAFHYPPIRGSSGVQRTLKFSRYLPSLGWQPIVLTAHPRAYASVGDEQLSEIPAEVPVERAFALDTARHLSIRGAYVRWMAWPDRWATWWLGAIPAGLRLIRRHRPQYIWSTFPIATAHLIGLTLHRLTGVPWIADFRDSMTEDNYPRDPRTRKIYLAIERRAVRHACRLVFVADSTRRMYLERYPELRPERCLLIPNGYDESDFADPIFAAPAAEAPNSPLRLLHAGTLYPEERDARPFLRALARLKGEGTLDAADARFEFRASGADRHYGAIIDDLGIGDLVKLLPGVPYHDALQECARADALLLFQGQSCDHQIPAKLYEYLRVGRPILALTTERGDTGTLLRQTGGGTIIDMADEEAIHSALPGFLKAVRAQTHPAADRSTVERFTRFNQTRDLARNLAELGD